MSTLDLLLLALATFYLAYSVTKKDGPFEVFKKLRTRLPLGGLTTCFVCCVLWSALSFYVLLTLFAPVVYVFAAAGGSVLLYRQTGGDLLV